MKERLNVRLRKQEDIFRQWLKTFCIQVTEHWSNGICNYHLCQPGAKEHVKLNQTLNIVILKGQRPPVNSGIRSKNMYLCCTEQMRDIF